MGGPGHQHEAAVMDDYWGAVWLYAAGVLTGAALCGWQPAWMRRWDERRRQREEDRSSERMRRALQKAGLLKDENNR